MKTTKQFENEICEKLNEQIIKRRERLQRRENDNLIKSICGFDCVIFAPLTGYKLRKVENNRPLTLLGEKEKAKQNFVAFVNIKEFENHNCEKWTRYAFFDISEDKKTISCGYPCVTITHYAYEDARKDPGEIYILTNKNIQTYKENVKKHAQRERAKHEINENLRFVNIGEKYIFNDIINQSYNYKRGCYRYYSYEANDFDKSGYFVKYRLEDLHERAKKLKAQREQERKEKAQNEYINNRVLRGRFINQLTNSKNDLIKTINEFEKYKYVLRDNKTLNFIISINNLIDLVNEKIAILQDDENPRNNHENATKYTQRAQDYVLIVNYLKNYLSEKLSNDLTDYYVVDNKILIDYAWRKEYGYFMCEGANKQ